jgi:hypothetical protein
MEQEVLWGRLTGPSSSATALIPLLRTSGQAHKLLELQLEKNTDILKNRAPPPPKDIVHLFLFDWSCPGHSCSSLQMPSPAGVTPSDRKQDRAHGWGREQCDLRAKVTRMKEMIACLALKKMQVPQCSKTTSRVKTKLAPALGAPRL